MRKSTILTSLFVLAACVGIVYVSNASAASTDTRESIVLSPVSQRFNLEPGAVQSSEMTAVNDGTVAQRIVVYSRPYSVKNEAYDPDYASASSITDAYQWVQLAVTQYIIKPGETVTIPYRLQVPKAAAPGGHYGVIFIETQPSGESGDSVIRKKRVGTILLVNVAGTADRSGQLISSTAAFWQQHAPLQTSTRVQNDGNIDFQVSSVLTVKDLFGKVKHKQQQEFVVYPGTTRKITMEWSDAVWFGLFTVDQVTTVLDETTNARHVVLMAPRWLPLTLLGVVIVAIARAVVRRRRE